MRPSVESRAWAQKRNGEMLKAIPPSKGGNRTPRGGGKKSRADPRSRNGAARAAGITKKQQQTALKLVDIPEARRVTHARSANLSHRPPPRRSA